ncbi:Piwi domain-domain-containing protein [Phakopsora pachyrhizi]|uniref:Piwi domain-domain-containing protein n=1 Tax=Phakopsora pachyrhizi TaxID=170000 RepID=A0AAV0AIG9_PHAPC|nr:Piwi domain-domain-containing protein [Phakopsora pachyrhizi]
MVCTNAKVAYNYFGCEVTFIVCVKIHRIRFEPHPDDADRSSNSQPGTIVDKVIVDPFLHNFYLQCQAGLKGTSCPSRNVALKDETNHNFNDLQNIANSVCCGFQRATRSVQIATPTYYANIVATRAKKWDMSYDNNSTVFTTKSGTQTPGERQHEFN